MTQLNNLDSRFNTNLGMVQNQVTNLQQNISNCLASPVNLYQNCYQDTQSCTLDPAFQIGVDREDFKPYCYTSYLSINVAVS